MPSVGDLHPMLAPSLPPDKPPFSLQTFASEVDDGGPRRPIGKQEAYRGQGEMVFPYPSQASQLALPPPQSQHAVQPFLGGTIGLDS